MLLFTLDHITDIVICLDNDAQVFYANHAAIERLGYDLKTLLTKSIHDIAPHFSATMWLEFWNMLSTHISFEMDSLLATSDGEELAVNMSFTYLAPKKEAYCCVVMRDIGARRQTEAAIQQLNQELTNVIGQQEQRLHDSQTRLRNLADNIPGMIYQMRLDLDPGGKSQSLTFTYASSGCMDVFGFFPEALQANSHLMFNRVHPGDSESLRASMLHSAQTLNPWNWEGRIVLPTGQLKWLEGRAQPSYEAGNQVVWDGVFIDVTITKRREQALQAIVESTNPQPGETFFHSCAKAIATALQMRYVLIGEIHTQDNDTSLQASSVVFWQGTIFGEQVTYDLADTPCGRVLQKNDIYHCNNNVQQKFPASSLLTELDVSSYVGIPIHDTSGTVTGHIAVMDTQPLLNDFSLPDYVLRIFATRVGTELNRQRAVSALQTSEMQLRQQTTELEKALVEIQQTHAQMMQSEKMSSLGELLAGVAHDIKNPVGFIYGNVRHATSYVQDLMELISLYRTHYPHPNPLIQELLDEIDVDFVMEDLPKVLASMKLGAETIKQIVKSLGNFSHMDESEKSLNNIHEGLDCTIMILQSRLQGKSNCPAIEIQREYGNIPPVMCYGGQLNQVFMNIISNAIDALEDAAAQRQQQGSKPQLMPCIRLHTAMIDEWVQITITDNGNGMPEEVRSRLFDTFFTTKPLGKGTGMGLSISHKIITEKHSGKLECFSTLGQGTEFVITIPLA